MSWGKQVVAAWNAAHPGEKVTGQEIPTGKTSEAVIQASIIAGTEPCLIYNTSPASVPSFQQIGGLVALDQFPGAAQLHRAAHAVSQAEQYRVAGRPVLPAAVEVQPGDDLLQQEAVRQGRARPEPSEAVELLRLPRAAQEDRVVARGQVRDLSGAVERVLPVLVRLLLDVHRRERRPAADRERQGDLRRRRRSRRRRLLARRSTRTTSPARRPTTATRSPTASRRCRSSGRGRSRPTRARSTGASVPVPTPGGTPSAHTFSDAKNVAMYASCTNRLTAWDFLKFSTSKEQDGKFLDDHRADADAHEHADDLRRASSPRTRATRRSPSSPPAWSRCRTCPTPSRSGSSSATPGPKSVIFGDGNVDRRSPARRTASTTVVKK